MLLARLSGHTRDKCVWYVLSIWRIKSWGPNSVGFIKFGEDKTLIKNNPLFSNSGIDWYYERSSKGSLKNPKDKKNQVNNTCDHGK